VKIVIVGSGAAGATAAQFARKSNREAEIVLLSRETYGEYSKCGMPYALSGVVDSFEKLIEYPPAWFQRMGIEIRPGSSVRGIDAPARSLTVGSPSGDEESLHWNTLILATGARTRIPPIKGATRPDGRPVEGVYTLRTLDDARAIDEALAGPKRCLIVGAGLIGLEVAEAVMARGKNTDALVGVVDIAPHLLPGMIDEDIARVVQKAAAGHCVPFMLCSAVTSIRQDDGIRAELHAVASDDRSEIAADMLIVAAGIAPEVELARAAGCCIGTCGGIVVDGRCGTSVDGIYAAGDCTEYKDFITGRLAAVGLGSVAVRQGRVAGTNAAGGDDSMPRGLLNSRTTRLFGLEVAAVGPTLAQLKQDGIEPIVGKATGSSLPEYFPGGMSITAKVLAHPDDGRILGAQVIGEEGAHLRANAFAAAILNRMTIEEFSKLETCYAPPVAPTFDVITLAAEAARMRWKRGASPAS
jgi:NADPH-dependent 2,4-dienoyl-CoA reductase/sulfur reductase-like enzyme